MKIEKKTLNFEFGAERVNRHMYNDYSLPFFPKVEDFAIETRERLLFVSSTKNIKDTRSVIRILLSHVSHLISGIFYLAFFILHLAFLSC